MKARIFRYVSEDTPSTRNRYDCCGFVHYVKHVPYTPHNLELARWHCSHFTGERTGLLIGDVVACAELDELSPKDEFAIHVGGRRYLARHFAIYLGGSIYLSKYGWGGGLTITTLRELQKEYRTRWPLVLVPREPERTFSVPMTVYRA